MAELSDNEKPAVFEEADNALGLGGFYPHKGQLTDEEQQLLSCREIARKAMNWVEADRIRELLSTRGITLRDRLEGTVWHRSTQSHP